MGTLVALRGMPRGACGGGRVWLAGADFCGATAAAAVLGGQAQE